MKNFIFRLCIRNQFSFSPVVQTVKWSRRIAHQQGDIFVFGWELPNPEAVASARSKWKGEVESAAQHDSGVIRTQSAVVGASVSARLGEKRVQVSLVVVV